MDFAAVWSGISANDSWRAPLRMGEDRKTPRPATPARANNRWILSFLARATDRAAGLRRHGAPGNPGAYSSPPTGSGRTRIRASSSTATHPRSKAGSSAGRLARSKAACRSGRRSRCCRNKTTEGFCSCLRARSVPKSVSAETMMRPSSLARSKISYRRRPVARTPGHARHHGRSAAAARQGAATRHCPPEISRARNLTASPAAARARARHPPRSAAPR